MPAASVQSPTENVCITKYSSACFSISEHSQFGYRTTLQNDFKYNSVPSLVSDAIDWFARASPDTHVSR